jgi:hypothetical protein
MAGTNDCAIYATISDYDLMIEALDERRKELKLSCNELDDLAGIAAGYFAKCAGASQVKHLGWKSAFGVARALGLRLVFEIDPDATAATLAAARQRNANQARPGNFARGCHHHGHHHHHAPPATEKAPSKPAEPDTTAPSQSSPLAPNQ